MWHLLVWTLVALVLVPWTVLCWLLTRLLAGPDGLGVKPEQWMGWLDRWQIPVWLTDWLPMTTITQLKVLITAGTEWLVAMLSGPPDLLGSEVRQFPPVFRARSQSRQPLGAGFQDFL